MAAKKACCSRRTRERNEEEHERHEDREVARTVIGGAIVLGTLGMLGGMFRR